MEYYSAIERIELLIHKMIQMGLMGIMVHENGILKGISKGHMIYNSIF